MHSTHAILVKIPYAAEAAEKNLSEMKKEEIKEQWAFISKMTPAVTELMKDSEAGKAVWEEYIDWVVEKYFPEFAG